MRRTTTLLACVLLGATLSSLACGSGGPGLQLEGYAVLSADTFVEGPTSGRFIEPANGRTPPFENEQPVQGFSALLAETDSTFLAMTDNGFGTRDNSPDYLPAVYRLRPRFAAAGKPGTVRWELVFRLRDPDHRIPFALICDREFYPTSASAFRRPERPSEKNSAKVSGNESDATAKIPVDPRIRDQRLLTGADFDIESFRRMSDGTFWFGDEFGPWLLHTDAAGRVLEPPVPLPGVWAPQNPLLGGREPNAHASGGFEGMALGPEGKRLYPMLEKPLVGQDGRLNIYVFNTTTPRRADGWSTPDPHRPPYRYRLDPGAVGATEFTRLSGTRFLVVERDAEQGPKAKLKRIYEVDLTRTDAEGWLRKKLVLDLLHIPDPDDVGGSGTGFFSFPFVTTEAVAVLDSHRIVVANDNNYPFSVGRHAKTTGEPDDNELILVRLR